MAKPVVAARIELSEKIVVVRMSGQMVIVIGFVLAGQTVKPEIARIDSFEVFVQRVVAVVRTEIVAVVAVQKVNFEVVVRIECPGLGTQIESPGVVGRTID